MINFGDQLDPTGGLLDGHADVAFVYGPFDDRGLDLTPDRYPRRYPGRASRGPSMRLRLRRVAIRDPSRSRCEHHTRPRHRPSGIAVGGVAHPVRPTAHPTLFGSGVHGRSALSRTTHRPRSQDGIRTDRTKARETPVINGHFRSPTVTRKPGRSATLGPGWGRLVQGGSIPPAPRRGTRRIAGVPFVEIERTIGG